MSAWTDRLRFCTTGTSDGLQGANVVLAGGTRMFASFPMQRVSTGAGARAQLQLLYGSSLGASRFQRLHAMVPWNWVRARQGHSDLNAMVEMRRSFGQTLSRPRGRWELLWHSGRMGAHYRWNGNVNTTAPDPDPAFPNYTGNSSAYWPYGDKGVEAWPTASDDNPNVLYFEGAHDAEKIQNADGYCAGYQARIISRTGVPVDPSRCRIIGACGFDLYADTEGTLPGFVGFEQRRNAMDGSLTRWLDIPADGQWHWIVIVTGADLYPENSVYPSPYHTAAGVPEGHPGWPYDGPEYGGRTWAQIEAGGVDTPIDMMAFHGEVPGGPVLPPPVTPPPIEALPWPGAATRPVWSTRSSGGFLRWRPKNRPSSIAPTWSETAIVVVGAPGQPLSGAVLAAGSPAPTYSKVSGAAWVTVGSGGSLTGTAPAGEADYQIEVRATNSAGTADTTVFVRIRSTISAAILTTTLPAAIQDQPYLAEIEVTGTEPMTLAVTAGTLPAGLALVGRVITGTPTGTSGATVTLTLTDGTGATATRELTIAAGTAAQVPAITTQTLPAGTVGVDYAGELAADGLLPITWSVASGVLPPGLGIVDGASRNLIRNSLAVIAPGGTTPTHWTNWIGTVAGVAYSIVGSGVEDGLPYIDWRGVGTYTGTTGTTGPGTSFETSTQIPAVDGMAFAQSAHVRLAAGSLAGVTLNLRRFAQNASGGTIAGGGDGPVLSVTGAALATQRHEATFVMGGGAATAFVRPVLRIALVNGTAYDFTLRIAAPQLERGSVVRRLMHQGRTYVAGIVRGEDWNRLSNPMLTGAVAGTPGTIPTNTALATPAGLAWNVVGMGVDAVGGWVDMRLSGTYTAASGSAAFRFSSGVTRPAALPGQTWTIACDIALVAGTLNGISLVRLAVDERSETTYLTGGATSDFKSTLTGSLQRFTLTRTLWHAGTTRIDSYFAVSAVTPGVPMDATFRLRAPQVEQHPTAREFVLPGVVYPIGTPSAAPGGRITLAAANALGQDLRSYQVAITDPAADPVPRRWEIGPPGGGMAWGQR